MHKFFFLLQFKSDVGSVTIIFLVGYERLSFWLTFLK